MAGVVKEIRVKEGSTAKVGETVLTVESGLKEEGRASVPAKQEAAKAAPVSSDSGKGEQRGKRAAMKKQASKEEAQRDVTPAVEEEVSEEPAVEERNDLSVQEKQVEPDLAAEPAVPSGLEEQELPSVSGKIIPASPSVRRLAREIGVDIQQIHGSGPAGRISAEDVKNFAH